MSFLLEQSLEFKPPHYHFSICLNIVVSLNKPLSFQSNLGTLEVQEVRFFNNAEHLFSEKNGFILFILTISAYTA